MFQEDNAPNLSFAPPSQQSMPVLQKASIPSPSLPKRPYEENLSKNAYAGNMALHFG